MQNYQQRLEKFKKEREEIREKQRVLSKRLKQVTSNITHIEWKQRQ
jgi:hypothetical protein